jgi:membrane-associated phospholipid phosphatase
MIEAAPEWVVAGVLMVVALVLQGTAHGSLERSSFALICARIASLAGGYLLVAVWLWLVLRAGLKKEERWIDLVRGLGQQASDAVCFALVLNLILYIKLLVPLVRTVSYDRIYEAIDRALFSWLDPLIAWRARELQYNWVNDLYFTLFFGMFLASFFFHSLRSRSEFRRVFLASLLVQGIGGVLYLAAPAVGPFLYHPSANVLMGGTERYFYTVRRSELDGGIRWLSANAGYYLDCGLASMPSLHAAGSFVFLYYAWRHVRWLGMVYAPVFIWILFAALASRWHYGIDLIAGLGVACVSIALADRWISAHEGAARGRIEEVAAAGALA